MTLVRGGTASSAIVLVVAVLMLVGGTTALIVALTLVAASVLAMSVIGTYSRRSSTSFERVDKRAKDDGLSQSASPTQVSAAGYSGSVHSLYSARLFFYAGCLTVGELSWRLPGGVTISDAAFMLALVLALPIAARGGAVVWASRGGWPLMMLGLLLFGVTGAVTSFVASDQAGSLAVVLRVLYLFSLWLLLGRLVIAEQRHLVTAVMCWSLSVCLSGFAALQSVPSLSTVSSHRAVGLTTNVTILGASAAIALAPALAVLMATRGARPRVVIGLSVVGIMLALALSVSLNGLISAAAGCSVLLLLLPGRLRIAIGLGLPIVMAGIVFLPVVVGGEVATAFDRFAASTASPDDQNATFWLRVNIDQAAIDGITESPLVGRGFDQAGAITSTGSQVHNMLLMVWYEGGLGPIFGLCMLFVGIAMEAVAAFRRLQPGTSKTIVAGLLGSGLAALVFSMGNPMLFERYAAMGVMLAIGAGALATTPGLQARAAFGGAPDPEPE